MHRRRVHVSETQSEEERPRDREDRAGLTMSRFFNMHAYTHVYTYTGTYACKRTCGWRNEAPERLIIGISAGVIKRGLGRPDEILRGVAREGRLKRDGSPAPSVIGLARCVFSYASPRSDRSVIFQRARSRIRDAPRENERALNGGRARLHRAPRMNCAVPRASRNSNRFILLSIL